MSSGETQPQFDPAAALQKLSSIVTDNKGKASGGGGSVWRYAIVIIAVVAGIAVWSWVSWRKNRELANLRHEKNKAKILSDKAKVMQAVAEADEQIRDAQTQIDAAAEAIRIAEADIRAEEARYEADMRAIDSIRNWNDVLPGAR